MMVVMSLMAVLTAMSVPVMSGMLKHYRLAGDARSVSNVIAVAKTRAASAFTRGRVYVDVATGQYHVETWRKTDPAGWVAENSYGQLSVGNTFSLGGLSSAPPNTQTVMALAPSCRDDDGAAINNTACILFNSRGVPIDTTGTPTGADGLYVTDGAAVYGVTLSATGLTQLWRAQVAATPTWVRQ